MRISGLTVLTLAALTAQGMNHAATAHEGADVPKDHPIPPTTATDSIAPSELIAATSQPEVERSDLGWPGSVDRQAGPSVHSDPSIPMASVRSLPPDPQPVPLEAAAPDQLLATARENLAPTLPPLAPEHPREAQAETWQPMQQLVRQEAGLTSRSSTLAQTISIPTEQSEVKVAQGRSLSVIAPDGVSLRRVQLAQIVSLSVTNRTSRTIQIELVGRVGPLVLRPGQTRRLLANSRDMSLLYWSGPESGSIRLAASVAQIGRNALAVNLYQARFPTDNSAIYFPEPGINRVLRVF
ncbi:hypothetical protein BST81_15690 [Leptolyngbya sp. 'hensonii']|uniref:hypothetical protein n=1 Tax=Leptolyngbya sp. 'hensonii' TaxID=1922337 RepID=UPI00094FC736|nr:hypothetical protein [Leptolyngbya sp. 'hensonii']OLP17260.1 hypothetical protein BST81_15690 [Leptolyngbya sp. 'hensonii']